MSTNLIHGVPSIYGQCFNSHRLVKRKHINNYLVIVNLRATDTELPSGVFKYPMTMFFVR